MRREPDISAIAAWVVAGGIAGMAAPTLVAGVGARLREAGVPLSRLHITHDTLHPVFEGQVYRWLAGEAEAAKVPYRRDYDPDTWRLSPFYHLEQTGTRSLRRRLTEAAEREFAVLAEFRKMGLTDYLLIADAFGPDGSLGEMDCVYSSWMTDATEGFDAAHLAAIDALSPALSLALKTAALSGIARTLVHTYLGRGAGERVMRGRIVRGVAEKIDAVLWYSDLRGFTAITDTAAPDQVIPLLNAYADPVVSAVHAHGGDVIKFMGDGVLALFVADEPRAAGLAALAAAEDARRGVAKVDAERRAAGMIRSDLYLALHAGPVFFGNIGSDERLDFTAIGPTVNEVARIAAMCRSVDRPLLLSSTFVDMVDPERARVASVGRFALRGIGRAQDLYTLMDD
jgi:adenylate cyclase